MPFQRPTIPELIERVAADVESRLPGSDPRLRRSLLHALVRAQAGVAHGLYGYLDWLSKQIVPDTAEAEVLDRWASWWGVPRKAASAASGDVTFTGL
ncbi:MAG: baseplate J/gp47 family protein, partial [Gammaproteobacteria bacterium]